MNDHPTFSLEAMPLPMVYATHRIIRDCNARFARQFGFEREELVGQSFNRLYPRLADFVTVGERWQQNLAGGREYGDERIMQDANGNRFWCRVQGRSLLEQDPFAAALYSFEPFQRPVHTGLSERQNQIVSMVVQGKTNTQIAREIGLSKRTIESHRLRLCRALGLTNSSELVAWFVSDPT